MQPHPEQGFPSVNPPATIGRIRDLLDRLGYTEPRLLELLQLSASPGHRDRCTLLPLLLHRTAGGSALETLTRLFFLQQPVEVAAAERAIEPTRLAEWTDLGLVRVPGTDVVSTVRLDPVEGWIYASDRIDAAGVGRDTVLGVSPASRTLGLFTIRRTSRLTLDVGTGCGCLAVMAAGHSDQVVGVDCNPRAVRYAEFNALLNRQANLQFLEGDFFEPVRERTFDLVVGNLPFVVSPAKRFTFRDSGLLGDQMLETLVREAAPRLSEGGYCQFLGNWVLAAGEDWQQRLARWFQGTGCDAWVLHMKTDDAAAYAADWLRQTETHDLRQSADQFRAWLAYYEAQHIEAVGYGLITLRRATGRANWFRCESVPEVRAACGAAIARAFAMHDFLDSTRADHDLMDARLGRAPELRWEQQLCSSAEGWSLIASRLCLTTGLRYEGNADPTVVAIVTRCDHQTPLRSVLADVASLMGRDLDAIAPAALHTVRQLVSMGLLVPDGGQ